MLINETGRGILCIVDLHKKKFALVPLMAAPKHFRVRLSRWGYLARRGVDFFRPTNKIIRN